VQGEVQSQEGLEAKGEEGMKKFKICRRCKGRIYHDAYFSVNNKPYCLYCYTVEIEERKKEHTILDHY
jgi:hypothetical protein